MSAKIITKPHEAFVLLLDVGSSSAQQLCVENFSDLNSSLRLLDWIISRKIFTESNDHFSLIFFGHEVSRNNLPLKYPNIYIYNDEFEPAKIDFLKVMENEITTNLKIGGDYVSALFVALESMKVYIESIPSKSLLSKTITLVSNFAGLDNANDLMNSIKLIAAGFNALDAQLMVIGPDLNSEPKTHAQSIGFKFIKKLLTQVNGCSYSFNEGFSQLTFFVPKQIQPRGQPFNFELAADFSIKMQMYIKNTETSMKFSFNPVSSDSVDLKKVRKYETVSNSNGETHLNFSDIDQMPDAIFKAKTSSTLPTGKFVDKSDIIKGYRYGENLIPIGMAEQMFIEYPKEGKQLQLLQFTELKYILPQFILSNSRYFVPQAKDDTAFKSMNVLVSAMLEMGVVAVCRYAYNINANPRLCCLVPKISRKSGIPIFIHYLLPFNEDLRNYEFPLLEDVGEEPTEYQLDVIDEYISSLLLTEPNGSQEKMRCKTILNPKHQYQCQLLKQKAMYVNENIFKIEREKLLEGLSPPNNLLTNAKNVIESIRDCFSLERNEYTKLASFISNSSSCVTTT